MTGTPVRHPTTRSRPFDPHDGLRELRAAQPLARLHHSDGRLGWLVTSHELAREVLVDHRFSSSLDVMRGPADGEAVDVAAAAADQAAGLGGIIAAQRADVVPIGWCGREAVPARGQVPPERSRGARAAG